MDRVDLILHPVRFRILELFNRDTLTTQDIAERLPDVPKSTIYRQVRILLDAGLIAVDDTRPVRGVLEKTYRLDQPLRLGVEDMAEISPEKHVQYFQTYVMALIRGFSHYVQSSAVDNKVDMAADRTGYSEVIVFATTAELDSAFAAINEALRPLATNPPDDSRHRHKFAIITHPEKRE